MSARRETGSTAMTLWGWAVCLSTSWIMIQTVDLAFRVIR